MATMSAQHTRTQYVALQEAYNFLDQELFGGELPTCLITLHRRPKSRGYFIGDNFSSLILEDEKTSEIALNPDTFKNRSNKDILSTLAHEMVHLWQHIFGKPSRSGYHNAEWGKKMQAVGLMPSDTGQPGGKKTGDRMTHYIVAGGPFDVAATAFLARYGQAILWSSGRSSEVNSVNAKRKEKSAKSKTKFLCPTCDQAAWAKPTSNLICGDCQLPMVAKEDDEDGPDLMPHS